MQILNPFGPSLGANQIWTKGSDHEPKSGCVDLFDFMPKKYILGFSFIFYLFLLLPLFSLNHSNVRRKNIIENVYLKYISLSWSHGFL